MTGLEEQAIKSRRGYFCINEPWNWKRQRRQSSKFRSSYDEKWRGFFHPSFETLLLWWDWLPFLLLIVNRVGLDGWRRRRRYASERVHIWFLFASPGQILRRFEMEKVPEIPSTQTNRLGRLPREKSPSSMDTFSVHCCSSLVYVFRMEVKRSSCQYIDKAAKSRLKRVYFSLL